MTSVSEYQVRATQAEATREPRNVRPVDAQPVAQETPNERARPKTDSLQISEEAQAKLKADEADNQSRQSNELKDLDDGAKLQTANQALLAQGI